MDQNDGPSRRQRSGNPRAETRHVLSLEIIDHFGQHDEVESAVRPLLRNEHLLEANVRQVGASPSRLRQRRLRDVDRQNRIATPGEFPREDANRTADFERTRVARFWQGR
jgi:hypothetical protein